MPEGSRTLVINRPVGEVFAYMNDVSRETEWQPSLTEAEQHPPGETRVGTERRYASEFMGKELRNTYVVRVWEPNQRIVLETTDDSALEATSEIRWDQVADGTQVTMSVIAAPKGMMRFVPAQVLEAAFEGELDSALQRLKEILEQ